VVGAAADALGLHEVREDAGGLEGGDVAGGIPVTDRIAVLVELVLGEEDGELDLAGAARPSSPLSSRPAVSVVATSTPVPSIAA
jgi:hypothetical protein